MVEFFRDTVFSSRASSRYRHCYPHSSTAQGMCSSPPRHAAAAAVDKRDI